MWGLTVRPYMNILSYSIALHVKKVTTSFGSVLGTTRLKTVLFKTNKWRMLQWKRWLFSVGFKLSWCEAQHCCQCDAAMSLPTMQNPVSFMALKLSSGPAWIAMSLQFWLRKSQGLDGELCPALERKEVNWYQSWGTMLIHYNNNHKRNLMTNKSNQTSQNTIWEKCLWAKLSHYHKLKLSEIWSIWSHFQIVLKTVEVQFSSVTQLCPTLCDPMNRSTPGLPVHQQLLESTKTRVHWVSDAIQPSHPLSSIPFSSCLQSFPASGSFPASQLFSSSGQSIGVSALTSDLPINTQDWSPLEWTGWISFQSKGLSRVFSNTTVQKHQFFGAQLTQFFPFSLLLKPKTILIYSLFILQILVSIKKVSYISSFLTVNLRKGWIWEEAFFSIVLRIEDLRDRGGTTLHVNISRTMPLTW